jgi:hypothetical protein
MRRQRAQAMGLAAVAMVAMVSLLAFVIDAGSFFIVRRELQNAADAAALAGAYGMIVDHPTASSAASTYLYLNAPNAEKLCRHAVQFDPVADVHFGSTALAGGTSETITVTAHCEADYTFGRILNLGHRPISAQATAALGSWDTTVTPHEIHDYIASFVTPPVPPPAVRLIDH